MMGHVALTRASRYELAAVAGVTLVCAAMWIAFFPLLADDAYIPARYVRQLYAGNGLVFNAGERINALTSPLHTLLLASVQAFTADAVTAYRVLALVLTAFSLLAIANKRYPRLPDRLIFLVLTMASPLVAFWTIGGLETPLLLCLCSWLAWLALSTDAHNERARSAGIIALAAAATLTRYDSVLFVAPVAALALWRQRSDARVLIVAALAASIILLWLSFTQFYYGDILPTSYYVKAPLHPMQGELGRGVLYLLSFVVLSAMLVAVWQCAGVRRSPAARMRPYAVALGLGLVVEALYAIFAGTKHMMYAYRLFVPYLPALLLLVLPARDPAPGDRGAIARSSVAAFALLVYQAVFALVLYFLSENPNLSLLYREQEAGKEMYEFSTTGAKYTGTFLAAVSASAQEVDAHWRAVASRDRAPRLLVMTGGILPYLLPDSYVLESLVSYRHRCKPELYRFADYVQVVHKSSESIQLPVDGADREPWQRISAHPFTVRGLHRDPIDAVVEIWFRQNHSPLTLPPDIDGPCVSRTGPA